MHKYFKEVNLNSETTGTCSIEYRDIKVLDEYIKGLKLSDINAIEISEKEYDFIRKK